MLLRIMTGMLLIGLAAAPAAADSLRERLLASGEVGRLLPLDAYHSYLEPAGRMSTLSVAMVSEALDLGGAPEVLVEEYDSFTRARTQGWVPVALFQTAPGGYYYYHHPTTGAQEVFGYGDFLSYEQTTRGESMPQVRMRGQFSLSWSQERVPIGGRSQMVHAVKKQVVLRHEEPQPFLYKEQGLPELAELVAPPPGLRNVTAWDFRPPEDDTLGETVRKGLKLWGGTRWEKMRRPYGDRLTHLFYLLGYGGVCANYGGELTYLVRDPDGMLLRPTPGRVYGYFVLEGLTWNTDFFLSCSGGRRDFAVNLHTAGGGRVEVEFRDGMTVEEVLAPIRPQLEAQQKKAIYERILEMPLTHGIGNPVRLPPITGLLGPTGIPGQARQAGEGSGVLFEKAANAAPEGEGELVQPGPAGMR